MTALLEAQGLTCVRDRRALFECLDLSLSAATGLHIEGANGSGKTSLLRILCGLLVPQDGRVCWRGVDIRRERIEFHSELLYIGHAPAIKEELSAAANLRFYRALGRHAGNVDVEEALERVGLYGFEDVAVKNLSAGQRRRVALARLWLSTATLWLLDEPFTAIDSAGVEQLQARLRRHIEGGGIAVLTSHQTLSLSGLRRLRLG